MASRCRAFEGADGVEAVRFRDRSGREHVICRATPSPFGFGLKPETQLAELAGVELRYDAVFRQWLPHADADGRCGGNVYVAGDGATIGGAQAAAAHRRSLRPARCSTISKSRLQASIARARGARSRGCAVSSAVSRAPSPGQSKIIRDLDDDVMVCRCEGISAGELRASIRADFGPTEVNRLKAITRCGMGRCQGRFCGLAAAELTAQTLGIPLEAVGRLRTQPPVKPMPLALSLAENAAAAARDETSAPA